MQQLTKYILCISLCFFSMVTFAQTAKETDNHRIENEKVMSWLNDLYTQGVVVGEDSIFVSKETSRLLNDEHYRSLVYPKVYTWDMTKELIKNQEMKKAFWYFINLYTVSKENKEIVIKSVLMYNSLFKMDRVLKSVFYTYSLTDPEIGNVSEGHSEITAPHIMEKKLQTLRELLYYVEKQNAEKKNGKQ